MDFQTLIQQPESARDAAWENRFLDGFLQARVQVETPEPKTGPDGWPYLLVRTSPEATEPVARVLNWLTGRGIGLAVNAHKMVPDYVFTYGMLWNFKETGRFVVPTPERSAAEPGRKLLMGAPTPKYLPPYVREVLREFLREQRFLRPKILVISSEDYKDVDLAFSLESLGGLGEKDQKTLAEGLAWFLPLHYNVTLVTEQNLPKFGDL